MSVMEGKRLSAPRVVLGVAVASALAAGGVVGTQWWSARADTPHAAPWTAGYVDVTATPTYAFEEGRSADHRDVVLSFVVAGKGGGCTPTWGTAYTMDEAADRLDLDRRIARLRQQGGDLAVSFGGQRNRELAITCTDATELAAAYGAVLDRYDTDTMDLDLEGAALADEASSVRRAEAVADLQRQRRAAGESLAVWLTLPVAPTGLTEEGTTAVDRFLAAGVDLAGVNAMTMDYGAARGDASMLRASEDALTAVQRQLGVLYERRGTHLSDGTLWSKVGATPMIGQNDVRDEVFTLDDAKALNAFAHDRGVGRMSFWSANRDATCGSNYVDVRMVSTACSGVAQGEATFTDVLGEGFDGALNAGAGARTTPEPTETAQQDDPATSPYPIWQQSAAYLKGTKVTWHRSVYVAKWWTRGDLPDDPVLNAWETPWQLVGPVLPGDRPAPAPTLPAGTFPEWSGKTEYRKGDQVLLEGVPYEAKWWNQAASPAAASVDPDGSPWRQLTIEQADAR
ncbi:chitinase [Amnibacterium endophyticum]|uniref:Chitinase n=1 Tax=Amnibacterium endophyticum TaxID=2109337 RepID=A0ABW4LDA4_9MICO